MTKKKYIAKVAKTIPSNDEIIKEKNGLKEYADSLLKIRMANKNGSRINSKLKLIAEELKTMQNIPYSIIKASLEEKIGLSVNEQTLRIFFKNEFGIEKKSKKNSEKTSEEDSEKTAERNKALLDAYVRNVDKIVDN
ncbi:MAG: hypothetical protein NTV00_17155 [Methylococcales bacterium]|nr:hypothetical protein [Methylococcales bacterium]